MTENLTTKEQFQSWIEQSMDEETVLFEWIVPENYPRQPGEDVAEAYRITANDDDDQEFQTFEDLISELLPH